MYLKEDLTNTSLLNDISQVKTFKFIDLGVQINSDSDLDQCVQIHLRILVDTDPPTHSNSALDSTLYKSDPDMNHFMPVYYRRECGMLNTEPI